MVIIGAGPAGAAAALTLAPGLRVVLLDRHAQPVDRIGETLPGAARRLLSVLGLPAEFLDDHPPCHARRSTWGGPEPIDLDSLRDLDGPGWRLNRRLFEVQLRAAAEQRGAELLAPVRVLDAERVAGRWQVTIATGASASLPLRVSATLLVDATGRGSRLSRRLGGRGTAGDKLICAWTYLPLDRPGPGISYVESAPDGWWYTAPVPGKRRVLAFHTDSDLARTSALAGRLTDRSRLSATLTDAVKDSRLDGATPIRWCVAGGSRRGRLAGEGWLAVGDAGMSFDPLSSQGLFHALYTGWAGGQAAGRMLTGRPEAAAEFTAGLEDVWAAYRANRSSYYGVEQRWAEQPFWRRRQAELPVADLWPAQDALTALG